MNRAATIEPGVRKDGGHEASAVALVQNYLGNDGRSRTVAEIIRLLNQRGTEPDLFTFSSDEDEAVFRRASGSELRFNRVAIKRPRFLVGDLLQEAVLPLMLRSRLAVYPVIIASGTSVHGFPRGSRLVRFVYFPLERVPANEERYQQLPFRVYGLACSLLLRLSAFGSRKDGAWIVNSEFTREATAEAYGLRRDAITVLYPPILPGPDAAPAERKRAVVSLGGFHQDKRQLEQIEVARSLPDVDFYLIGSSRSRDYYHKCVAAAGSVPNVHLVPNAAWPQVEAILSTAKVFLHSKRNEHFGMSSAEAITYGCIPVVHDSGGQREVVPNPELRFTDPASLSRLLRRAIEGDFDSLLPGLQQHVQEFSVGKFQARLADVLEGELSS